MFVAEINSRPKRESLYSILRLQKTSVSELTEARIILEPSVAKLVSERITSKNLLKLERNIRETSAIVRSNSLAPDQSIEFQSIITESTHNSVLALIIKILFYVLKEWLSQITNDPKARAEARSGDLRRSEKSQVRE